MNKSPINKTHITTPFISESSTNDTLVHIIFFKKTGTISSDKISTTRFLPIPSLKSLLQVQAKTEKVAHLVHAAELLFFFQDKCDSYRLNHV